MPRTFKTKEELSKMSIKELLHYKKYLGTVINDLKKEAHNWNNARLALQDEMVEALRDLEWEASLSQVIREECDHSQIDFLLNIH